VSFCQTCTQKIIKLCYQTSAIDEIPQGKYNNEFSPAHDAEEFRVALFPVPDLPQVVQGGVLDLRLGLENLHPGERLVG